MNNYRNSSNNGIGFFGLLAIVFIILKLMNIISWSWLWVLAPLWMPFCLLLVLLTIIICIID
jgi:hypothetical protein